MNQRFTNRSLLMLALVVTRAVYAQDVPPPPRPSVEGPGLAYTMRLLQQKVNSVAELQWVERYVDKERQRKYLYSSNITDADSRTCRIRSSNAQVLYHWGYGGLVGHGYDEGQKTRGQRDFYADDIESVQVRQLSDSSSLFPYPSKSHIRDIAPAVFEIVLSGPENGPVIYLAPTVDVANQIADAFRASAHMCSVAQATRPTRATEPTLPETMSFIAGKLNSEGEHRATAVDAEDSSYAWSTKGSNFSTDVVTCKLRYDSSEILVAGDTRELVFSTGGSLIVSFSRVARIEVMPVPEWLSRRTGTRIKAFDPAFYALVLTFKDGERKSLYFDDNTLADRIAKAMVHAVELCGGGSKEPF